MNKWATCPLGAVLAQKVIVAQLVVVLALPDAAYRLIRRLKVGVESARARDPAGRLLGRSWFGARQTARHFCQGCCDAWGWAGRHGVGDASV